MLSNVVTSVFLSLSLCPSHLVLSCYRIHVFLVMFSTGFVKPSRRKIEAGAVCIVGLLVVHTLSSLGFHVAFAAWFRLRMYNN